MNPNVERGRRALARILTRVASWLGAQAMVQESNVIHRPVWMDSQVWTVCGKQADKWPVVFAYHPTCSECER